MAPQLEKHQALFSDTNADRAKIRALVKAHLDANKPIEDLNIAPNKPDNLQDFAFVGITPKCLSRYRCSFCETNNKFAEGKIVLSSDGELRLIGNDCWSNHIDEETYQRERKDFQNYLRLQRFQKIQDKISPLLVQNSKELRMAILHYEDEFVFVQNLPLKIRSEAPALLKQLAKAQKNGGRFNVERLVTDHAAIEQGKQTASKFQLVSVHQFTDLNFIISSCKPLKADLVTALKLLYAAHNKIVDTQWSTCSNTKGAQIIVEIEKDIANAIQIVLPIAKRVRHVYNFLSDRNLNGLAKWGSDSDCELHYGNEELHVIPNGFRLISNRQNIFEICRPINLTPDPFPDFSELSRLLNSGP